MKRAVGMIRIRLSDADLDKACDQHCSAICAYIKSMKLAASLGMSPYEEIIEECTYLSPDLPVGVNMETMSIDDCEIHFHPKLGMQENVKVLCLEQRYQKHKDKAHRYLTIKQQYDENKIEEMVKAGYFPSSDIAYRILYGEALQDSDSGRPELLRKLKHDLVGR